MATVNREAIETFMSIAGVSETIAVQKLEDYGGNLNEAINAHFIEGDRNLVQETPATVTSAPNDFMEIDDPTEIEHPSSLLSANRDFNHFSLLDPTFRSNLFDDRDLSDRSSDLMGRAQFVSQPRQGRESPLEFKDGHDSLASHSGHTPRIEVATETLHAEGPGTRGTVIIDDEDDRIRENLLGNQRSASNDEPSAPQFDDRITHENDIEEQMIRAAIEASKRDAELHNTQGLHDVGPVQMPSHRDDVDFEHAISLSLKAAEQERLEQEHGLKAGASGSSVDKPVEVEKHGEINKTIERRQGVGASEKPLLSQHKKEAGSSSSPLDGEDWDDRPLSRRRFRHRSSSSEEAHREAGESEVNPALSPSRSNVASQTQPNGNAFPSDEWGGISSEEHDEAVMLEAAMFGGIPENGYHVPYAPHELMHSGLDTWRTPHLPSPSLVAQRAIREQQDDDYYAALQADKEKELRAMEEVKAAKEAALQEQRHKEEESRRKVEEEQEVEKQLAAKQASLPEEPLSDDENAVTLLVRMPDGGRHGRRFRKSDKLESFFDFIDVERGVKPGTYRVVRPFPRRAFSAEEKSSTLNELGLTSKQEALFLELV